MSKNTRNIEAEKAEKNVKLLSTLQLCDRVVNAIANEDEIMRLALTVENHLKVAARDLADMSERFTVCGTDAIYNTTNEAFSANAVMRGLISCRRLYKDLLKKGAEEAMERAANIGELAEVETHAKESGIIETIA
jgi:hypothetical protein